MQARSWILLACVAGCGGSDPVIELLPGAKSCERVPDVEFCLDFDDPAKSLTPFGFDEFLGGDTTMLVGVGGDDHGLSITSGGSTVAQSTKLTLDGSTHLAMEATIEPFETAPGKALVLGLTVFDGSSPFGRQVWVVAHDDDTLTVNALGTDVATTGTIGTGVRTKVRIEASWLPGGTTMTLDAFAGPAAGTVAPILEGHVVALGLTPPPNVTVSIASISLEPGDRRFVFDNVALDLE